MRGDHEMIANLIAKKIADLMAENESLKKEIDLLKIQNANGNEAMELMRWVNSRNPGIITLALHAAKEERQGSSSC